MQLATYAVTPDRDERKYPQPDDPWRNGFQRDRDRVIHCSAFRRLDFKTQVFVPHEHDHFRTRLTHSLEVAQVGRDIGRALGLNEDLIEAAALAHDLGHPPFGHIGEKVLDELMTDYGHFEHNRQTLRVVDYLEHPYPSFRGLNLTQMTRLCLSKHECRYESPMDREFSDVPQGPLEGQLVDLADEMAYTAADVEDALGSEWLNLDDLAELEIWRMAWQGVLEKYPDARDVHKRIRATKQMLSMMIGDVIVTSREKIASYKPADCDEVMSLPCKLIGMSEEIRRLLDPLQDMMMAKVYKHEMNMIQAKKARMMLETLFEYYTSQPERIPPRFLQRVTDGVDSLHRVVCDYLAGMTDKYCRQQYEKI